MKAPSDYPDFTECWQNWLAFRHKHRWTCSALYQERCLAKMAQWGPAKSIQAMNASMDNGWMGLFEPKQGKAGKATNAAGEYSQSF